MKMTKVLMFALLLSNAGLCRADDEIGYGRFGLIDAMAEVLLLRPLGVAATIAGTAFFVVTSPITALADISPPHDAFKKMADVFIVSPAKFTFDRPMGVYYPDAEGEYSYPRQP